MTTVDSSAAKPKTYHQIEEYLVSAVAGIPASEACPNSEMPDQSLTASDVQPANTAAGSVAPDATVAEVKLSQPANTPSPRVVADETSALATPLCE